jgi:hypothetical protein
VYRVLRPARNRAWLGAESEIVVGQTEASMDRRAFIGILAALMCVSGCTTPPDWIGRTLVTVDVTGSWYGVSPVRTNSGYPELWLELQQEGPKAKGSTRANTGGMQRSGPIEGTIAGDVFTFRQTNGPLTGELTVSGDEMTGEILQPLRFPIVLRRAGSPPRPDSRRQ